MFLSKGLTCYTEVESNGRDASYSKPNRLPNVRQRQETRMHAQMTVSQAPCSKVSPARLTYLPQVGQLASGSSNFSAKGPPHPPHTHCFNVRARSASTSPPPQNCEPSHVLSRVLTCYTEVGSNGRDVHLKTQTVCQTCDLEQRTHAPQMMVSPSPHAPKKCRQHGLTSSHIGQLASSSSNFVQGPPRDLVHAPHRFRVRTRFGLQQAQTPPKFGPPLPDVPI
jgi:hypothetical protein